MIDCEVNRRVGEMLTVEEPGRYDVEAPTPFS
jgi:hypothetical protein